MDYAFYFLTLPLTVLLWLLLWMGPFCAILWLGYYFISLRLRRHERARFFLDVVETGLKDGRRLEDTIISMARARDASMGVHFHLLAAYLEKGLALREAMAKVPHLLSPAVSAMLRAGMQIGDLGKVLPACRKLSRDAISQTRGAINYLILIAFVGFPVNLTLLVILQIYVFPQLMAVVSEMGFTPPAGLVLLEEHKSVFFAVQLLLVLVVWGAAFVYLDVPRIFPWLERALAPLMHRMVFLLPWHRKRMQRDFSGMLAILLDAGMPEPEALIAAGECAANQIFQRRVGVAVAALRQGMKLPEAVQLVDDSGEFRWRLTQALHTHGGFFKAITGWTESLDAKAFQQEQATAQTVTTALVLVNGMIVGFIVVSVFSVLISILNGGLLW